MVYDALLSVDLDFHRIMSTILSVCSYDYIIWFQSWMLRVFNPLTAGADYIRFLYFLLACTISFFKPIEDKMLH